VRKRRRSLKFLDPLPGTLDALLSARQHPGGPMHASSLSLQWLHAAEHRSRGIALAAASMVACFVIGMQSGLLPLILVALAVAAAAQLEAWEAGAALPVFRWSAPVPASRVMVTARDNVASTASIPVPTTAAAAPHWQVVEVNGVQQLRVTWRSPSNLSE
jgi:hypothetical protein